MKYCDLTLSSPEENLACDEALLEFAEDGPEEGSTSGAVAGILRFWEAARYFVALGYGKERSKEVNLEFCLRNTVPVLRRCTGGGTVLQGPGVLNYALILNVRTHHSLRNITSTNQFIMETHRSALARLLHAPVEVSGHTDLSIGGLKFSGNAQRRRKEYILFHGAFLLHLDVDLVEQALTLPSMQPDYRLSRAHREFLMNLNVDANLIKQSLRAAWRAQAPLESIPYERLDKLVREKYSKEEWNTRM